jgi:O-antigen ligase
LAVTALPVVVPYGTQIGPISVFLYEPFLYIAALYTIRRLSIGTAALRCVAVLITLVVATAAHGLLRGHPTIEIVGDARGLTTVCAALIVTAGVCRSGQTSALLRTIRWSLWVSAAVTVVGSVSGLALNGRAETAALFVGGAQQATDAVRFLTAATHFSLAVLCASLALLVTRRATIRQVTPYLAPALLITFLGFSRNSLLAVGIAVIAAVLVDRSALTLAGIFRGLAATVALVAVIAGLGAANVPGAAWASLQAHAYFDRVIVGGLDDDVRRLDSSALSREAENRYAEAAVDRAPLVGHGLGYAYRPGYGPKDSFTATKGQYYIHNFYLWLLVKSGILGLVLWLLVIVPPIIRHALKPSPWGIATVAAALGVAAVNFVAPLPIGYDASGPMTVGIILGCLVTGGAYSTVRAGRSMPMSPVAPAPSY